MNHRADILRNNARALTDNDRAYAEAVEWNVRVFGLPASGVLTLAICAIVAVVVIAIAFFVWRYRMREEEIRYLNKAEDGEIEVELDNYSVAKRGTGNKYEAFTVNVYVDAKPKS